MKTAREILLELLTAFLKGLRSPEKENPVIPPEILRREAQKYD